jgi:hypothetical protein
MNLLDQANGSKTKVAMVKIFLSSTGITIVCIHQALFFNWLGSFCCVKHFIIVQIRQL